MKAHLSRANNLLNITFLQEGPLLSGVSLVHLGQGQLLFNQGEVAESCFLVISGCLKIVMKDKAAESIIAIISKGEIGGALLMASPAARFPGSIVALSQASLFLIPRQTFNDHWMKNPEALAFINLSIRNRIKHLQEDKFRQLLSVENRTIGFLHRHFVEKGDLLSKKITRKEIAMSVGAKTETIIRVLKKLELSGVIKTQKSIITVLDEGYLARNLKDSN